MVLRDVVIAGGAIAYRLVVGHLEMQPTWFSKINTALEFAVLAGVLAQAALKGSDATPGAVEPGDIALIEANAAAALADLALAGFPETFARTFFAYEAPDVVAVGFTPSTAFFQTPGPQAGRRL
jgi:phosphatidylglycerophosphate synthase